MPYKLNKTKMEEIIRGVAVRTMDLMNDGKMTSDEINNEISTMSELAAEDIMDCCCCDEDCNEDCDCKV